MGCVCTIPLPEPRSPELNAPPPAGPDADAAVAVPKSAAKPRQLTTEQRNAICRGVNAREWVAFARANGMYYGDMEFGKSDTDVGSAWLNERDAPKGIDSVGPDVWIRQYQLCFSWADTMIQTLLRHWYATGNLPRNWSRCRMFVAGRPMATPQNLFYTFRWHDVCAGDWVCVAPREAIDSRDVFADAIEFVAQKLTQLRECDAAARAARPVGDNYYDNQWIFHIRRHPERRVSPRDEFEIDTIPRDPETLLVLTIDEQIALYRWQEHVLRWVMELEAGRRPRAELAAFDWVPIDSVVTERIVALVRAALTEYTTADGGGHFPTALIDMTAAYVEVRLHDTPMRLEPVERPHFKCLRSASIACDGDEGGEFLI